MKICQSCFRWIARIIGGLTVLFFLAFFIGEGFPIFALSTLSSGEKIMSLALAVALAGLLVSWRWTLIGCLLTLAGYIVFSVGNFLGSGKSLGLANPFSLFLIILALYAVSWGFGRVSALRTKPVNG